MNPLSAIYAGFVSGRNRLYDSHVFRQNKLRGPVISVGNLSVGGSGKTPFVILLGQLLRQRGIEFDVLSRGYGRQTRGAMIVDANGSPRRFGDEPLLIARKLGCRVLVGERRYEAGLLAEETFGPRVHILDDGFQHRSLARDFDIVMLSSEDLTARMLPVGRLREPLSSLNRADAIVIDDAVGFTAPAGKDLWKIRRSIEVTDISANPIAFCGIARPQRFIAALEKNGISPMATRFFRDHHAYTDAEIEELSRLRESTGATGFVTTEKDAVNLGDRVSRLAPVAVARVCMELVDAADALDTILRVIADHKPPA